MLPSKRQTGDGTPPSSSQCRILLTIPRRELLRCKTQAETESCLIAAAKRRVEKWASQLAERRKKARALLAPSHTATDAPNSKPDVKPMPVVPKVEQNNAQNSSRPVQQQKANQIRAHPEKNVDPQSERIYAAVASKGGRVTPDQVRAAKEEVARRRGLKNEQKKRGQSRSKSDVVHE